MRIVEYKNISSGVSAKSLDTRVIELIQAGWSPLGGVSLIGNGIINQPMVKYEEEKNGR